jgi:hypothetical protein
MLKIINIFKCIFCDMSNKHTFKIIYGNIIINKYGMLIIENLHSKCINCDDLIIN